MAVRIESHAEPIPGYRLIERVGGGGFGDVWKAEAPGGLMKAIKFVYGNLETVGVGEDGARAEQELKALSRVKTVRHPFILSLERFDIIDGQLLVVMELADRNLWDRFRECRERGLPGIPREELLGYMDEVADALDLMNLQYDLQHLDIKPQNIFLIHNHVKVADFGLVKDLEGLQATVTGGVTPVYAAPETFDGWVSRFSDQYSLAIVYQEMLTGKRPFVSSNTRQLIMMHIQGVPDLESLPESDRPLIAKSLSKVPTDRHPNCKALIKALRGSTTDSGPVIHIPDLPPVLEPTDTTPPPPRRLPPEGAAEANGNTKPPRTATFTQLKRDLPDLDDASPAGDHEQSTVPNEVLQAEHPERLNGLPPPQLSEERGEGVIVPALIIGVGRTGQAVLVQMRRQLLQHGVTETPHLGFLAIDTDPESADQLTRGQVLNPDEVLLTRLHRPSKYLRQRENMPPLEDWLDPKMIYRIPRSLVTTGIRALGRLAFLGNHRAIVNRIRRALEQITSRDRLHKVAAMSGLGLRSNWPRVYIATGLAGGTGSGMFLDLAYVVRDLLREMGYERQEVIGLLHLPSEEERRASLHKANTYAALIELHHYMQGRRTFEARYDTRAAAVRESGPPFTRCLFLTTPRKSSPADLEHAARTSGDYLYRDLMTPLGRAADAARSRLLRPSAIPYESVGLQVVPSMRRSKIETEALLLSQGLLDLWIAKAEAEPPPSLRSSMLAQLYELRLDPPTLEAQLDAAYAREWGQSVSDAIAAWLEPLTQPGPGGWPDLRAVETFRQTLEEHLGLPQESNTLRPPAAVRLFREVVEAVGENARHPLADLAFQPVDQPGRRLAAAEDTARQLAGILEEWLEQQEDRIRQRGIEFNTSSDNLRSLTAECEKALAQGKRGEPRRPALLEALVECARQHALVRYQQLVAQRLSALYWGLRGRLSDQIKEIGFFRHRLMEFRKALGGETDAADQPRDRWSGSRNNSNNGKKPSLAVAPFSNETMASLDALAQKAIQREFTSLVRLCALPGRGLAEKVKTLLLHEARSLVDQQTTQQDVAQGFLEQHAHRPSILGQLDEAFEKAEQTLIPAKGGGEVLLALLPDSPSGQLLAKSITAAMPEVQPILTRGGEELVFYRESVGLSLAELPYLDLAAREAYQLSCAHGHFTPHSRIDVAAWDEPAP